MGFAADTIARRTSPIDFCSTCAYDTMLTALRLLINITSSTVSAPAAVALHVIQHRYLGFVDKRLLYRYRTDSEDECSPLKHKQVKYNQGCFSYV